MEDWLKNEWLQAHRTSADEVGRLLDVVARDLADGAVAATSDDGRFLRSYNAALQAAVVALHAIGLKPEKGLNHHFRALQSLGETIALPKAELAVLETYRKKRNITEYERSGVVTAKDAEAMLALAKKIDAQVREFIQLKNPELLSKSPKK